MINRLSSNLPRLQKLATAVARPQQKAAVPASPARASLARPDTFEAARVSTARAPVNKDGLLTYRELNTKQRALLGPNGATAYGKLSTDDRAVFLLLTKRMDRAGVDYSGLRLKGDPSTAIARNRMHFDNNPAGMARLRASLDKGIDKGTFKKSPVFEPFHKGMADWGVREERLKWSLQLGTGSQGAFVDVDRYNPNKGPVGKAGHLAEIADRRKPDPIKIARELGTDIHSSNTRAARLSA